MWAILANSLAEGSTLIEVSAKKSIPLSVSMRLVAATLSTPFALAMTSKIGLTTAGYFRENPDNILSASPALTIIAA
ncbi:MAG: Uncharacterised protein [Flavobacteriaceae bacterium]|nr:MAG: Uncharacterised protein [Flavobacteriaceae bacterium]